MDLRLPHRFDPTNSSQRLQAPDFLHMRQQQRRAEDAEVELQTFVVSVDSSQRDRIQYPTSDRFKVYLRNPISNILKCELASAEVPNVAYTIDSTNNVFRFEEDLSGVLSAKTFMIPTGHYDGTTLCAEIGRLMNAFTSSSFPLPDTPYDVFLSTDRNKAIFNSRDPEIRKFRLVFDNDLKTPHRVLGFPGVTTPWSTEPVEDPGVDPEDPLYVNAVVSPGYFDVGGDLFVFLCSPELNSSFHEITYSKETTGSEALYSRTPPYAFGKLQLTGPPGSAVFYNNRTSPDVSKRFNPPISKLASLEFMWMRRDGTPVDFKNLENSFTIMFTCAARSLGNPQFVSQMTA